MPKLRKKAVGRPVTVPDGVYITLKLRGDQLRAARRIGGPAAGTLPRTLRGLIDAGLKTVARKR